MAAPEDSLLKMKDQPTATLRITNVSNQTTETEIRALFAPHGTVTGVRLILGLPDCRSPGFGFVEVRPGDVANTIAALDGALFRGAVIRLNDVSRGHPGSAVARRHANGAAPPTDTSAPDASARFRYELASVEPAVTPAGAQGADWCRYVLACGRSRITGFHHGTLEEVTAYATSCAEAFNSRSTSGKSRNPVVFSKK